MKSLGILVFILVAIQGESAESPDEIPSTPSVPWLVHLRFTRLSLRGKLDTCVGALYNDRWVLTAASCLMEDIEGYNITSRYIWSRFDTKHVFTPGFVIESLDVITHPQFDPITLENNLGLLDLNRRIEFTDKIQPIELAESDDQPPSSGRVCSYGEKDGKFGEDLFCVDVTVTEADGLLIAQSSVNASKYDIGAALVSDGKVHGILVRAADDNSAGAFLPTSKFLSWIEDVTNEKEPDSEETLEVDDNDVLVAE
ncbi:kallikrein-7-like [Pieris brassicae]|uniref:kallikrein-7-like n=1 Tax=Pieris brassicae TaxID=7116 RepID=UPI001E65E4EC|nr:kallikrein-7-like [Pieris brassicae]